MKVFLCGAFDSSINLDLFELYNIVGMLNSGVDKSSVLLLDQCRLCPNEHESPSIERDIYVSS